MSAEISPREKHLGLARQVQSKEVGQSHGDAIEDFLERTHRWTHAVLLDEGNQAVGDARAFREFTLREAVHLPHGFQMGADI